MPVFGYKNHLGIDRAHGFIRRFVVTDAARHNGAQLGAVLHPDNTGAPFNRTNTGNALVFGCKFTLDGPTFFGR